jgi:hypothetical protein
MSSDKRDAERVPMLGHLQGEVMVFQPMLIKEISVGGAWSRPASRCTSTRCTTCV